MKSLKGTELAFPREEFQTRLQRTRDGLVELGLDAGIFFGAESICYLSGYGTPSHYGFQHLVVPVEQDPFFATRKPMVTGFEADSWIDRYGPFPDGADPIQATIQALKRAKLDKTRLGFEESAPPLMLPGDPRPSSPMPCRRPSWRPAIRNLRTISPVTPWGSAFRRRRMKPECSASGRATTCRCKSR